MRNDFRKETDTEICFGFKNWVYGVFTVKIKVLTIRKSQLNSRFTRNSSKFVSDGVDLYDAFKVKTNLGVCNRGEHNPKNHMRATG